MTHTTQRLFELDMSGEYAAQLATQRMSQAGLPVQRSFDLRAAREAHPDCPCPHHGTAACSCQFIVLLVYPEADSAPVTLMVHSQDEHSWFELQEAQAGECAQGSADQIIEALFAAAPA